MTALRSGERFYSWDIWRLVRLGRWPAVMARVIELGELPEQSRINFALALPSTYERMVKNWHALDEDDKAAFAVDVVHAWACERAPSLAETAGGRAAGPGSANGAQQAP